MTKSLTGMDSGLDLDAIRARADAATPGPWGAHGRAVYEARQSLANCPSCWATPVLEPADADFIAHAREDVPALLAALADANTRIAALEAAESREVLIRVVDKQRELIAQMREQERIARRAAVADANTRLAAVSVLAERWKKSETSPLLRDAAFMLAAAIAAGGAS